MFHLALEGNNCYAIAKILESESVLIPKAFSMTKAGKADNASYPKHPCSWSKQTVYGILTNPTYTGDLYCLRYATKSFKDKRIISKPQDEWIVISGTHEPLVSKQDFETVQQRVAAKQTAHQENPANIFRGLVYCSDCNTRLAFQHRVDSRNSRGCYRCARHIRFGKNECSPHYIKIEQIEQIVLNDLKKHIRISGKDKEKYARHLMELSVSGKGSELSSRKRSAEKSQKRLKELDKLLQKLYEDKVFGIISEERYITMSESMETEQAALKKKLSEDMDYINCCSEQTKGIEEFVKLISKYESISELDYELVHTLIDKIVVHERKTLDGDVTMRVDIYYRFIGNIGGESFDVPDLKRKNK